MTLHHEVLAECPEPKVFHGLRIEPENRCSPYSQDDYSHPDSLKQGVIDQQGGIFIPYNYQCFANADEVNIDHVVGLSEAHDSGLCSADAEVKEQFANDLLNLTLIPVEPMAYNPRGEGEEDVTEWVPQVNECWFAGTVIQVKLKYGLSVDQAEAEALDGILEGCNEYDMAMHGPDWPECVEE